MSNKLAVQLQALSVVGELALEIQKQITARSGDARRLGELSMATELARVLAGMINSGQVDATRLAELGMVTDAAKLIANSVVSAPVLVGSITLTGEAETGSTLTCPEGNWIGADSISFQWVRGSAEVAGETDATFLLDEDAEGGLFSCRVTATNENGSTVANSNQVGPVTVGVAGT